VSYLDLNIAADLEAANQINLNPSSLNKLDSTFPVITVRKYEKACNIELQAFI
jgi:hypothetical protein